MTPSSPTEPAIAARPHDSEALVAALAAWAPRQRWFPAKGTSGELTPIAVVDLVDPAGEREDGGDDAVVEVHLLRLPAGGVLQVPVVLRPAGTPGGSPDEVLATLDAGAHPRFAGPVHVVDGCHDVAFVRAWLGAATRATGHARPDGAPDLTGMRVLTGEQSNTSVLLPSATPPGILKVFRGVSTGPNPDVEVPLALSRVWDGVPRPIAWLSASWPGGSGHLGVLSEFVSGAQDGFELACAHARDDVPFDDLAHDLGRTTAAMHRALRIALPFTDGEQGRDPRAEAAQVVRTLRERAAAAVAAAPVLQDRAAAVEEVLATVERLGDLPPLQRVHGDYHLGQVLRSPARGWAVLDFEGEPQAPREERTRPDLALRDLAGMLRSIDYAAAVGEARSPQWGVRARAALVAGYQAEAARDQDEGERTATLLRALELDKALYEVVYETRNRPAWLPIPLQGVDRLLGQAGPSPTG